LSLSHNIRSHKFAYRIRMTVKHPFIYSAYSMILLYSDVIQITVTILLYSVYRSSTLRILIPETRIQIALSIFQGTAWIISNTFLY